MLNEFYKLIINNKNTLLTYNYFSMLIKLINKLINIF